MGAAAVLPAPVRDMPALPCFAGWSVGILCGGSGCVPVSTEYVSIDAREAHSFRSAGLASAWFFHGRVWPSMESSAESKYLQNLTIVPAWISRVCSGADCIYCGPGYQYAPYLTFHVGARLAELGAGAGRRARPHLPSNHSGTVRSGHPGGGTPARLAAHLPCGIWGNFGPVPARPVLYHQQLSGHLVCILQECRKPRPVELGILLEATLAPSGDNTKTVVEWSGVGVDGQAILQGVSYSWPGVDHGHGPVLIACGCPLASTRR